ncbi:MAG: hypothetical protein WBB85_22450 [Albidovulum sp.]|uniref:hypothetical protein n=1 Tax=Albidovulum sp. TaxID=1872424 RepID=UPI003CB1E7E5
MMRLVIALVLPLLLTGCKEEFAWRQKMTVTVETPAGEVSGSSVSAVSWQEHAVRFPDGMGWHYNVTGEAVVVEVTPGRYLFALIEGPSANYLGSVAPASIAGRKGRVINPDLFDEVRDKRDRAAGVIAVPDYQYPMMVTFADIADPASVALVDPDDLAASFGPGVRLKSVTLEVTDAPVTEGRLEARLPWLLQAGFKRFSVIPRSNDSRTTSPTNRNSPEELLPISAFLTLNHWAAE